MKTLDCTSRVFTDLFSNSLKRSPRLSPGNEGSEKMFYLQAASSNTSKLRHLHLISSSRSWLDAPPFFFFFSQIFIKIHNKDDEINVFSLPCVIVLFPFIEMSSGTLFGEHSSFGSCYYIKDEKASKIVCLLGRVTHRNGQNLPMATIFIYLAFKIFEHILSENGRDPTHCTILSVH